MRTEDRMQREVQRGEMHCTGPAGHREIKWRASSYRPARTEGKRRGGGEEEREEVGGEEEEEEERVAVRRVG